MLYPPALSAYHIKSFKLIIIKRLANIKSHDILSCVFQYGEELQRQSAETLCCQHVPIILCLDRVMADRKMSLNELAARVGIANVNLSKIKTGKVSAIRFSTLEALCDVLDCQPGDILEFRRDAR